MVGLPTSADTVEEKWPSGKTKLRYTTDKDGKKFGEYLEYYETGKLKIRAKYTADELNGPYASFHPNSKPHITANYKQGKLNGEWKERDEEGKPIESAVYLDGELQGTKTIYDKGKPLLVQGYLKGILAYPKGVEQIRAKLAEILGPAKPEAEKKPTRRKNPVPTANPTDKISEEDAALQRLKAYRYLCDLPYEDLTLDDKMTQAAQAAAGICAKIGKLDHKPANPGMPEEEYKLAYEGTSHANLAMGASVVSGSVNMWMDDSDPSNIDRLGHRQWCLNPEMLKTGFGRNGKWSAMWSMDRSRKDVPDYDFICFPPRGYMPTEGYFKADYAWSVSLNLSKYHKPDKSVQVKVFPMDVKFNKSSEPLKNNYFNVDTTGFGLGNCIIFRPEKLDISSGQRYWVEITGLKTTDNKDARVEYLVEFVDLKP